MQDEYPTEYKRMGIEIEEVGKLAEKYGN